MGRFEVVGADAAQLYLARPLAHLLRNRFYVGEVAFKGEVLKGEQPAILDKALFDAVQVKLTAQVNGHKATRMQSEVLLTGRIFDDRGNRMSPSHARKGNVKYRYYLSSALVCTENLNPNILVVKAAKDRARTDGSISLNRARDRRIFVQ